VDGGGCTVQLWDGGDRDYPTVRWRGDGLSNCGMVRLGTIQQWDGGVGSIQPWDGGGMDYPAVGWSRDYLPLGRRGRDYPTVG